MRYAFLGGLVVLFVLGFLIYAKSRLPDPTPPRDREEAQAALDGAASQADDVEPPAFRPARPEPHATAEDDPIEDPVPEAPSTADADAATTRRTADPSQDDDTGTSDPRRYTQDDDRGSSEDQIRRASALREWIGNQKALMADVTVIEERVRGGDAAAAQEFNDAFDALARDLVDTFGPRLAHEYAKRIPIYQMDVETGALTRVDETGMEVEEPARRGGRGDG